MSEVVGASQGESGSVASATPSATASPAVTTGSQASPVAAPIAPSPDPGSTASAEPKGPIPFDRHDEIVKGFHKRLDSLKWAESLDPNRYREMSEWWEMADRNPLEFFKRFESGLKRHPVWGQYLQTPTPQADAPKEPEPDLIAENGQPVYSAPQLKKWQEWNQSKLKSEFQRMVSPLLQKEQQSSLQAQAQDFAKRAITELSGLPGFDELKPQIAEFLKSDRRLSPLGAYKKAYDEFYKPKLAQAQRQSVLDEMNQKAQANTANPAPSAATPASFKDMEWNDVLAHFAGKKR